MPTETTATLATEMMAKPLESPQPETNEAPQSPTQPFANEANVTPISDEITNRDAVDAPTWISTLLERGGRDGKPISAKTARHAYALLNAALRWGIRMEIVGRNVCDAVTPPSPGRTTAVALTIDEVGSLSAMARGTRWEAFIAIALMLGARRGEVLALTWNDVDLEAGRVAIRASLSQTKGAVALKSTKTDRVRVVPITGSTEAAFRKQRAQQAADRLLAGSGYGVDLTQPIFADELGAPSIAEGRDERLRPSG